jgi:hypothetical protein
MTDDDKEVFSKPATPDKTPRQLAMLAAERRRASEQRDYDAPGCRKGKVSQAIASSSQPPIASSPPQSNIHVKATTPSHIMTKQELSLWRRKLRSRVRLEALGREAVACEASLRDAKAAKATFRAEHPIAGSWHTMALWGTGFLDPAALARWGLLCQRHAAASLAHTASLAQAQPAGEQGTLFLESADAYVLERVRAALAATFTFLVQCDQARGIVGTPDPVRVWHKVTTVLVRRGICNAPASPPTDRTLSLNEREVLVDAQLAFRPAAFQCARALVLADVQSLLDLPTALQLQRDVIEQVWVALQLPQAEECGVQGGPPGTYISGETIAGVLALLPYTETSVHVPRRESLQQTNVHSLTQATLKQPPAGATHITLVVNCNLHYGALVLELHAYGTVAKFYDSLENGSRFIPTTWVDDVAQKLATAMRVPLPCPVQVVTDKLQEDSCSCGVFALMRVLCLAAANRVQPAAGSDVVTGSLSGREGALALPTQLGLQRSPRAEQGAGCACSPRGNASLPEVTDTAWADSCRTLLQAAAHVSVGLGDLRSPRAAQQPQAAIGLWPTLPIPPGTLTSL